MTKTIFSLGLILLLAFSSMGHAYEASDAVGVQSNGTHGINAEPRSNVTGPEIACLLKSIHRVSPYPKWSSLNADIAGRAIAKAMNKLNVDGQTMNYSSLLYFLAMISYESAAGTRLVESGGHSFSRTGLGYMQVTGPANIAEAAACVNRAVPGAGKAILKNPYATIGSDPDLAAMASVCWWTKNMMGVQANARYARVASLKNIYPIAAICNSGRPNGPIINASRCMPVRQHYLEDLMHSGYHGDCSTAHLRF